jgi:hypothetical protein
MKHSHGDPGLTCTFEQQWGFRCPFEGQRFWPGDACLDCGRKDGHRNGCQRARYEIVLMRRNGRFVKSLGTGSKFAVKRMAEKAYRKYDDSYYIERRQL